MSEFHVQVVRLGKIGKHPNADSLSITTVNGYPVIFKTGVFNEGDLAVRIPVDAVVDTSRTAFNWLADKAKDGKFHVKATKIRGVPSHGFLVPMSDVPYEWEQGVGQDVAGLLGVTKYDDGSDSAGGDVITGTINLPVYDIEALRKYPNLFTPGEQVVVTEKIHGQNGRWFYGDGKLLSGSRTKWRENSVWNRMAAKYKLETILDKKGLMLFGEVYGPGCQDLTYGVKEPSVMFFDIYDTGEGKWWDVDRQTLFFSLYGLPTVPVLYNGPYDLDLLRSMAEGQSTVQGAGHVREGIVVKPVAERWHHSVGRVFLKLAGDGYLLRGK